VNEQVLLAPTASRIGSLTTSLLHSNSNSTTCPTTHMHMCYSYKLHSQSTVHIHHMKMLYTHATHTYTHTYTHAYVHAIRTCCTHMHTCMYHACTRTHAIHTYIHTCYTHASYAYVICTHAHTHAHTHTHTHYCSVFQVCTGMSAKDGSSLPPEGKPPLAPSFGPRV
jgi:hypothetical protein